MRSYAHRGRFCLLSGCAVLKKDVQFLNLSCYVVELERLPLEVGQRITIPIIDDTLLNESVEARYLSHNRLDILI